MVVLSLGESEPAAVEDITRDWREGQLQHRWAGGRGAEISEGVGVRQSLKGRVRFLEQRETCWSAEEQRRTEQSLAERKDLEAGSPGAVVTYQHRLEHVASAHRIFWGARRCRQHCQLCVSPALAHTEEGKKELLFLSDANPGQLERLCAYL